MSLEHMHIKPFIKWAGGKTQLLEILEENFPSELLKKGNKIQRYVEPFIGGGALFFDVVKYLNEYKFEEIIINDINSKLINVYKCLQENCDLLIEKLEELKTEYFSLETLEEKETMFYRIRESFNEANEDIYLQSAEFIFLNKTCFNGLYRESKKGLFNVPFGKHKNPSIYDEDNLREISKLLNLKNSAGERIVKILNLEYHKLDEYIDSSTLVYFDPPYRPVTKGGFNEYTKGTFNDESQVQLAEFCKALDKKGAHFLLSNSDPKNLDAEDNFFDDLYDEFYIQRIYASRRINSKGTGRGNITELLIKNYDFERKVEQKKEVGQEIAFTPTLEDMQKLKLLLDNADELLKLLSKQQNVEGISNLKISEEILRIENNLIETSSIQWSKDIKDRFDKFCEKHKQYSKTALINMAILEFMEKYK